jgi:hypothetical protein
MDACLTRQCRYRARWPMFLPPIQGARRRRAIRSRSWADNERLSVLSGGIRLVLGILVVVHEFGHYLAARWVGVKVLRFSVGFGRPLWAKRFGAGRHRVGDCRFPAGRLCQDGRRARRRGCCRGLAAQLQPAAGAVANSHCCSGAGGQLSCWPLCSIGDSSGTVPRSSSRFWVAPVAESAAAAAGLEDGELVLKVAGRKFRPGRRCAGCCCSGPSIRI